MDKAMWMTSFPPEDLIFIEDVLLMEIFKNLVLSDVRPRIFTRYTYFNIIEVY